jgi:hypothetical protein
LNQDNTTSDFSSSGDSGCGEIIAKIVGFIIGIILLVVVAIWLALNIVLPVVLLNSALASTILALCFKERKTLFASFALVGGCYMLIDIFSGWFSAIFVNNVVGNPVWITCFVYINAAATGLSSWFLVQPIWSSAIQIEATDKRKSILLKGLSILLVVIATLTIPIVYHFASTGIQNSSSVNIKDSEVSHFDVPTIRATVISFRLFESGSGELPQEKRDYGTIFIKSQTRYINWEVQLKYPPTQNGVDFPLKAVWYRSDGSILY